MSIVEAVVVWELLEKLVSACRHRKAHDLLGAIYLLECKKRELTRLIENGGSEFLNARQA